MIGYRLRGGVPGDRHSPEEVDEEAEGRAQPATHHVFVNQKRQRRDSEVSLFLSLGWVQTNPYNIGEHPY